MALTGNTKEYRSLTTIKYRTVCIAQVHVVKYSPQQLIPPEIQLILAVLTNNSIPSVYWAEVVNKADAQWSNNQ